MLLPDPAKNAGSGQGSVLEEWEEHTFTVDPQERARRLPFRKCTALREPLRCSSMVNIGCDIVIRGWIWWGDPSSKALSQLVPYKRIRNAKAVAKELITNISRHLEPPSRPFRLANISSR